MLYEHVGFTRFSCLAGCDDAKRLNQEASQAAAHLSDGVQAARRLAARQFVVQEHMAERLKASNLHLVSELDPCGFLVQTSQPQLLYALRMHTLCHAKYYPEL
jgi:hypothetical protein